MPPIYSDQSERALGVYRAGRAGGLGGVDGAGLTNFAASIVTFGRTCVNSKLSRPSSHVIVNLNGILTPATSR